MFINTDSKPKSRPVHTITFSGLGFGEDVPYNTLQAMRKIIIASAKNYDVIQFARDIVQYQPAKNQTAEVTAIYDYIRNKTRYIRDPQGTEHIQTPLVAIDTIKNHQIFQGDCDDMTVLVLSLLKSIGYPVMLISAGYGKDKRLSHVYGAVQMKDNTGTHWTIIEPIKLGVPIGWEAPGKTKMMTLRV